MNNSEEGLWLWNKCRNMSMFEELFLITFTCTNNAIQGWNDCYKKDGQIVSEYVQMMQSFASQLTSIGCAIS